ncbi:protein shuttle craft isoform X1 [Drosophila sulfurigaster albostrigata]|uniref:protein shuttle craft isoform X1 n=1 Tax=Drosophila sulfurigaster albostrigata TaxID=89887 RepID=UPI002D21A4E1|nr:protein shuttle craft isoform X1 [Drosophila sulfurigaster albostrigata]
MDQYWQRQQQQQLQQEQFVANESGADLVSPDESAAVCHGGNNNNYVNFNQFITQHNLATSNLSYSNGAGGAVFGLTPNNSNYGGLPCAQPFFGYQNGDGAAGGSRGIASSNNYQESLRHALDINPFASANSFDFSTSKLQASAPEFVPTFAKLSLSASPATATATGLGEQSPRSSSSSNNHNKCNINGNNSTAIVSSETTNHHHHQQQHHQQHNQQAQQPKAYGSNSRQQRRNDYREDRIDRNDDRYDRKKPQKQQRYDNHRSNKRRDDWNRNRDRINGYARASEELDTSNSNDSAHPSPEKQKQHQISPRRAGPDNEKLSQREKLMRDIEQRRLECLVCVEQIKPHHGTWSCQNCYHVLHLKCTITWASSSKSAEGWRCPACQNVLQELPREYLCFCGKLKNPPLTRTELAHSCGELCCRAEGCNHACTLLCHPGPCPPCQANVSRSCGCGRTSKLMQCSMKQPLQCESICDKLLNCGEHRCQQLCHAGKCENCAEKVQQHCHCGKQQRGVMCTKESQDRRSYSCKECCGKPLPCGNHKCKDSCHAGACRPCKLSPIQITTCPCGKLPVAVEQRASCLDPVPTCDSMCGKTLRCGKPAHPHQCTSKCHLGQCPPCPKQTAVKCRCGHMDQMIKCRQLSTRADDARCKRRCTKKRSCGKHKCNAECCIDLDHACPLPCNRTLSCGRHKCDQPCHRGNCPPCYRSSFEELYCECGAEVIYPPVPCGTKKPVCKRPCSRTHGCEHVPQHNCHAAAICPPCMMFTTKWCHGNHEQRKTIPCSQLSFSCGLACGKPLACGRHKCIRPCHEDDCQQAGELCRQSCTKPRVLCGHKCAAPCHEGSCPETPCKELVEVQCECGNRKQNRSCQELAREHSRIATAQLASSMAEMSRGNYMELSEILAPGKASKSNKTLDCNEECRLLERNRRLAIGLQSRNPDTQLKSLTKYSEFTRGFAKRNPALTKSVYETLSDLVKLAKESKQKSRSHSFPTMNREKRQLVHELCEVFGIESVSYDKEPNRNVVATAYKERCWLPATSIMEVLARESGQRRVPVPSNNAWGLKK